MVWKHDGLMAYKDILSNMRITSFLHKARKKLSPLFRQNDLYGIYDFEAAFLCIVCYGIDHWAWKSLRYFNVRLEKNMGIPDLLAFITIFAEQNKPIIRESRLKYLAKSKMLQKFSIFLNSIDEELSDCVYLINSE